MGKYDVQQILYIILNIVYILIISSSIFIIIKANIYKKIYFEIDNNGIKYEQYIFSEKNIKWNDELYYLVTKSLFKIYSLKDMKPLEGKILNQNNIEYGYISIKTKQNIKIMRDNKGWICIPSAFLGNKIKINEIINTINEYRGFSE